MLYSVTVVAQQDRHLRQILDQERTVECPVEESAFAVESAKMKEVVQGEVFNRGSSRTARVLEEGWSKDFEGDDENENEELERILGAAR